MNGVLIFVCIVFALAAIIGYVKGLIKIAASLLATIIMIVIVTLLSPHVSKWIQNGTPLREKVQSKIEMMMKDKLPEGVADLEIKLPKEQEFQVIENAEIPDVFKKMLLNNNNEEVYRTLGVKSFQEYIGAYITKVLADAIAFLALFVIVLIAFPIVIKILDLVNKLPVIGGMNRLAGAAVGLLIGLAIVWVFFIVVTLAYNTAFGKSCFDAIESSAFLAKLYDSNILLNMIVKF